MLSRPTAAAALATTLVALACTLTAPVAYADGGTGKAGCDNSAVIVTVCAQDRLRTPGTPGTTGKAANRSGKGGGGSASKCHYEKAVPQPPPTNLAVKEGKRRGGKGAVYRVTCPDTLRMGVVWLPEGGGAPAAPAIDPETVARKAVDSMTLKGPKIESPRAAGTYTVGVPMWMHVARGPSVFGPQSATATAGGVTVTAKAKVSTIRWDMKDPGDPAPIVCHGPGTKYKASYGMAMSPDCGHRYQKTSASAPGERFAVTATSSWTITWEVVGAGPDSGSWTETRTSTIPIRVGEMQVLD
ncbi:ATP/GTP-binding protein [Streptomyces sp. NPDC058471]|uniref:ATP/GTP-binding protein n=1 Tax=Streptomyces sp. NPDC058471 TaxID=3346516 RepID=UPI00364F70BB